MRDTLHNFAMPNSNRTPLRWYFERRGFVIFSTRSLHRSRMPLDTTSPELALAAASGKRFATVTLAALSRGDDHEFLRFVLKNATITSVLFGGDSVSSSRTET